MLQFLFHFYFYSYLSLTELHLLKHLKLQEPAVASSAEAAAVIVPDFAVRASWLELLLRLDLARKTALQVRTSMWLGKFQEPLVTSNYSAKAYLLELPLVPRGRACEAICP